MKRHISGNELRDRLLSRMTSLEDAEPTEEMRIEALSSSGNRELLEIIATKRPRSISELATLAGRLQPNVSRSLTALGRAGLLVMIHDGRASVPTLTQHGKRKAQELGFVSVAEISAATSPSAEEDNERLLSATIVEPDDSDLVSDAVQAKVVLRFPSGEGQQSVTTRTLVDLNDVSRNLLANWWRIVCRRGDPFKMFPIQRKTDEGISQAIVLAECTGHIELFVRSAAENRDEWALRRLSFAADEFAKIVLEEFVRPLVSRLRAGNLFDRPIESLLRRTEEILQNPADLAFWRSAGAFGLTYQSMTDRAAADVASLMKAVLSEDARLELASAVAPDQLGQALLWIEDEIAAKATINGLPKLIELRRGQAIGIASAKPWRVGVDRAREARRQIGLTEDRPVGGLAGLARMFGGSSQFAASAAGEELLRGFQGHGDKIPVIVVKDEGPKSTAFLMSRAIGDYLVYGNREAAIADIYSDRQAVGRAFAAEFMAPATGVVEMIEEDGASLDTVAEHYGVVREVVRRQYENNVAQYAQASLA